MAVVNVGLLWAHACWLDDVMRCTAGDPSSHRRRLAGKLWLWVPWPYHAACVRACMCLFFSLQAVRFENNKVYVAEVRLDIGLDSASCDKVGCSTPSLSSIHALQH